MPIIQGEVASLRYLCVSQNKNYSVLFFSRRFFEFYIYQALISCGTILLSVFLGATPYYYTILVYETVVLAGTIAVLSSFRTKPKFTARMRCIFITQSLIVIVFTELTFIFIDNKVYLTIVTGSLNIVFPLITMISLCINNPYFNRKNDKFIAAKFEELRSSKVIRIGITGSYGKTGCKNILASILSEKYKVVFTEKNYNTPMGIALTVDGMDKNADIFIAEMGARKTGDIKFLADMLEPDHSITTGVCPQHMATFKSLHNIYMEKAYLSKKTKYISVFNGNDKYALKMYKEHVGQKIKVTCNKSGDFYATDIVMGPEGSVFNVRYEDKIMGLQTRLLGRHNVVNITLCVALAKSLGLSDEMIKNAVKNILPVPHRLEYSYANGIHILDDGYNSNVLGVKYALEVVDSFGCRRVVVSQGIAEGGKKSAELNIRVGREIAAHSDVIILCGKNADYLSRGIKEASFKGAIYKYGSLKKAERHFNEILRTGDVLLLQNDLPDVY